MVTLNTVCALVSTSLQNRTTKSEPCPYQDKLSVLTTSQQKHLQIEVYGLHNIKFFMVIKLLYKDRYLGIILESMSNPTRLDYS